MGIDPGSLRTGYGIIQIESNHPLCVTHGHIATRGNDVSQRLWQIHEGLIEIIEKFQPGEIAVEQVFVNQNPQTALKLGQARGSGAAGRGSFCITYSGV